MNTSSIITKVENFISPYFSSTNPNPMNELHSNNWVAKEKNLKASVWSMGGSCCFLGITKLPHTHFFFLNVLITKWSQTATFLVLYQTSLSKLKTSPNNGQKNKKKSQPFHFLKHELYNYTRYLCFVPNAKSFTSCRDINLNLLYKQVSVGTMDFILLLSLLYYIHIIIIIPSPSQNFIEQHNHALSNLILYLHPSCCFSTT